MKYKLEIKSEQYYNNGNLMLRFLEDGKQEALEEKIREWLRCDCELTAKSRKNKQSGINANELNKALRNNLCIPGVRKETHVVYNGFSHKGIEGFDFSFYDEKYNIAQIRNYFVGERECYNGEERLKNAYKDLNMPAKEWKEELSKITVPYGTTYRTEKKRLTVVGEIQFGNWALLEHDIQRLINATEQGISIDYYIYITATGNLAEKLSDGIVNYEKTSEFLEKNGKLLKVPMWLIGLDINQKEDETS